MKSNRFVKVTVLAAACAFALAIAAGCSSSSAPSGAADTSEGAATSEPVAAVESSEPVAAVESSPEVAPVAATSPDVQKVEEPTSTVDEPVSDARASGLTKEEAIEQGYQVFEGTVYVCDGEQLIELQGIDIDPAAAGGGGTYAVLVFDQPTDVTGMSADGSGERTESAEMLGIAEYTEYDSFTVEYGVLEVCESLAGQHVAVAAMAEDIMFPSDVRLPIGQPAASEIAILS